MNKRPVMYLQGDERWGNVPYTIRKDPKQTIKSSGCGVASMSMILAIWIDKNITPRECAKDALANGYRTLNSGTDWSYFSHVSKKYGLKFKQTENVNEMLEAVKSGAYAVLSMRPPTFTRYGHFICLWDYTNGIARVNDPASTIRTNKTWSADVFRRECGQCFIFYPPTNKVVCPTVPKNTTKINVNEIKFRKKCIVVCDKLNCRKSPISGEIITTYKKNDKLTIVDWTTDKKWGKLVTSKWIGWICLDYVNMA